MNRYYKFGVGACVLVAAIGYLMYAGLQQSSTYYFTIDEFLPRKQDLAGQGVRVAGRVASGSLVKQTSAKGTEMKFAIGEFKGGGEIGETLPVAFTGIVPDMFAEGRDVIIEGRYLDGTLHAQQIMTSCPSKYEPKPGEAPATDAQASAK
jgi:cytochrome c-type biogenesis protein CcmE